MAMANSKSSIAENIKKYRKKKGITEEKLSKLANITYNTIIKIESGANHNPKVQTLKRIADALGGDVDDFMK
jgi:transcriptional regulator with XRE-family HTH domain